MFGYILSSQLLTTPFHFWDRLLANAIAATIGEFYSIDPTTLKDYAQARTTAMLQRDAYQEMGQVTEDNWKQIEQNLIQAYTSLTKELDKQKL